MVAGHPAAVLRERRELQEMITFSNDADILKYEPILFGELHLRSQVLSAGSGGTLSGVTFTAADADFVGASVEAGGVVYLRSADGVVDGAFEIVSVDSATQLSVSVVRSDSADGAVAPPGASDVSYRISTFGPQAAEVAFALTEYFGIRPGDAESEIEAEDILDLSVLKRVSVFGVISGVYAMLGSGAGGEDFRTKSLHYSELYAKARERCRLSIDCDADGVTDVRKSGGSVRLVRD